MRSRWYLHRNGRPPDYDEYTYRWNGRRWERLEEDDALDDWEIKLRQRMTDFVGFWQPPNE